MVQVIIVGSGDLAREIYYTIMELNNEITDNRYQVIGFLDYSSSSSISELEGVKVYKRNEIMTLNLSDINFIVGIGSIEYRTESIKDLEDIGVRNWLNVIHPSAVIGEDTTLGNGIYIAANATISISVNIKDHCIINQNCSIGHDVIIRQNSVLSPGCLISGRVSIGESVYFGSGAIVVPKIKVGNKSIIGANTLINKDVEELNQVMSSVRIISLPISRGK